MRRDELGGRRNEGRREGEGNGEGTRKGCDLGSGVKNENRGKRRER